ncbi:MAG: tail fiber protein [Bacteroidales bacterium]|nr:tail fiber protein [Bacteroidales bacterium]
MKNKIFALIVLFIVIAFGSAKADKTYISGYGTVAWKGTLYTNNLNKTWNIDTRQSSMPTKITYSIDTESDYDFVTIKQSTDSVNWTDMLYLSGFYNGVLFTNPTSQYIQIIFTSDGSVSNDENYQGIEISYSADNAVVTTSDLQIGGNGSILGSLGIGTTTPSQKLTVKGSSGALAGILSTNGTIAESATILFQNGRGLVGYDGSITGMRISTSDFSKPIVFTNSLTNGMGELMRITGTGNVGIGTTNPGSNKLYVNGITTLNGTTTVNGDISTSKSGGYVNYTGNTYSDVNWHASRIAFNRYRGTNIAPTAILNGDNVGFFDFFGYNGSSSLRVGQFSVSVDGTPNAIFIPGKFVITTTNNAGESINRLTAYANDNIAMATNGGKIGIGTTSPDQKLTVKGKIHAEEVIVDLAVPADYVFKADYTLRPLQEVEAYVKENSHLPEIPSASEIVQNGLNMGEMQNKLLQKVEELTLYIIQLQKEVNELKQAKK